GILALHEIDVRRMSLVSADNGLHWRRSDARSDTRRPARNRGVGSLQSTRRPRADLRLGARAIDVLNKATQPPFGAFGSDCRRCSHANTTFCRRESKMAGMR